MRQVPTVIPESLDRDADGGGRATFTESVLDQTGSCAGDRTAQLLASNDRRWLTHSLRARVCLLHPVMEQVVRCATSAGYWQMWADENITQRPDVVAQREHIFADELPQFALAVMV